MPLDVNASDSADVSVSVLPPADGALTASIIRSSFSGVTYVPVGSEDQIAQGKIQFKAVDTTGQGYPWAVRARIGSAFTDDQGNEIPIDRLGMEPDSVMNASRAASPDRSNRPRQRSVARLQQGESVSVLTCDTGNCQGEFVSTFAASMRVPAGSLVATYRATILVEMTAEPGQN